jgi:hypothetical protein
MKEHSSTRIPKASIVRGAPTVISTDDEFISFLDPSQFLIKEGGQIQYNRFAPGSPFGRAFAETPAGNINDAAGDKAEVVPIELPDVPNLTDIELFSSTKYYDPVTKVEKGKIVIKVTNTSRDKINIEGVDARVYNPSEKL